MTVILFFYGLAFLIMGITVLGDGNRRDVLGVARDVWLIGVFAILHGLNEWLDMLVIMGGIWNETILKGMGGVLFPASFIPLVLFGGRVIAREIASLKWLKHLWILCAAAFAAICFFKGDLFEGAAARYFIAFPGTILTGTAILLRFLRVKKDKKVPFLFSFGVGMLCGLFFLYGILSGLIVPRTDFLGASIINYDVFLNVFGLPVQLFRMICAIGLAVGFAIIMRVFTVSNRGGSINVRGGIRGKIIMMFLTITLTVVGVGLILGYAGSYHIVLNLVGRAQVGKAIGLAQSVGRIIDEEVLDINIYIRSSLCLESLREANARYDNMDPDEIRGYLLEMDKKWTASDKDSPIFKEYLESRESQRFSSLVTMDTGLAEIFITDRYGGLVIASGKTSDFYQADESWWKDAIEQSEGGTAIRDIEEDISSGIYGITLAAPIYDGEEKVGVYKGVLNPARVFTPLNSLYRESLSFVSIVDTKGNIIYGEKAIAGKHLSCENLKKIREEGKGWSTAVSRKKGRGQLFFAPINIDNKYLKSGGLEWWIVVEQPAAEVFKPLYILMLQGAILLAFLIPILLFGADLMGVYFSKAIKKLKKGVDQAAKGDLTTKVEIYTGDELEELAVAFNKMAAHLNETTVSNDKLVAEGKEREEIQQVLQKKQEELQNYAEKIKHTLDESQQTKRIMISMLEDNNSIREKLEESLKELKNAQSMLIQSEKLVSIGRLVSEMAHEVNNPLMIISARAQLVQMGELKEGELDDSCAIIEKQCYRARDIIQRLLMFSKPSTGSTKETDINESVEEAVGLLEHQYSLENIKMKRHYGKSLPLVNINKNEMEEVFLNLMKNAAEAMSEGGEISVTTSASGDNVYVVFQDNGKGMSQEVIKNIFDPFFTTKKEGTGLGLSVCYGIIKGHGGQLDYDSVPGKGTSATITLPIAREKGRRGIDDQA